MDKNSITDHFYYVGYGLIFLITGLVYLFYSLNYFKADFSILLWFMFVGFVIASMGFNTTTKNRDNTVFTMFGLSLSIFSFGFILAILNIVSLQVSTSIVIILISLLILIYGFKLK